MTNQLIRVKVTRSFGHYAAGDDLLVIEDAAIRAQIEAGLLDVIAIEVTSVPNVESSPESVSETAAPPKRKKKEAPKPKRKKKVS